MLINQERLFEVAEKQKIDAMVAATKENVLYCTEYWSLSQWTSSDVQVYAVVPVENTLRPTLVAPMADIDLTVGISSISQVVPYGTFHYESKELHDAEQRRLRELSLGQSARSPVEALASAIKALGFEESRIGLDEGVLHSDLLSEAGRLLPRANIVPANSIWANIRMIKTEEEIRRLRRAASITERAMIAALRIASEDASERNLATEFEKTLVSEGARPDFTVLAFGDRTALPNAQASQRKLKRGDAIRFDIGCVYDYYHSDISRMAVLGEASEKLRKYYEAIVHGHRKGLEMVRPGTRVSDIFEEIVRTVRQSGIPQFKRHHCGHGIGIEGYDLPLIKPTSREVIEEGMVLCIEPPFYELGWGGVQVEDTVVVRKSGAELLTSTDTNLIIV